MALPYTLANGQNPDATKLQADLDYLLALISGGAAIKIDTYSSLITYAALNPTAPFTCIATDQDLFMLYCGKVTRGAGGFFTLLSFGEIS